jgi:hypothetical protein
MDKIFEDIYLIVLTTSFLCSLLSFKLQYSHYLKFFSLFLGATVIVELGIKFIFYKFYKNSNYPVYNCFFLVQLFSMGYYFGLLIKSSLFKKTITSLVFFYALFWLYTSFFFYKTLDVWNAYAAMLGDLMIIIITSRYLFELFTGSELTSLKKHSAFWIAVGIMFFYSCELPINGILNYLINHNKYILAKKAVKILLLLNILMYLIFIYAYLCQKRLTAKKSFFSY